MLVRLLEVAVVPLKNSPADFARRTLKAAESRAERAHCAAEPGLWCPVTLRPMSDVDAHVLMVVPALHLRELHQEPEHGIVAIKGLTRELGSRNSRKLWSPFALGRLLNKARAVGDAIGWKTIS